MQTPASPADDETSLRNTRNLQLPTAGQIIHPNRAALDRPDLLQHVHPFVSPPSALPVPASSQRAPASAVLTTHQPDSTVLGTSVDPDQEGPVLPFCRSHILLLLRCISAEASPALVHFLAACSASRLPFLCTCLALARPVAAHTVSLSKLSTIQKHVRPPM